jgi:hypothetical protein
MRLMSRSSCVVLKGYATTPAAIARSGYRRGVVPVEAQGCRRNLGLLAAGVLDELNRSQSASFAGYAAGELRENVPIDFCNPRELASHSEPTKADRLRMDYAGADRKGALIDIEHPRHGVAHHQAPAGDEREAIRAQVDDMNVDFGLRVGRPNESGLRYVHTVVSPSRLHAPDVDHDEPQRRTRRAGRRHAVNLIAGALAVADDQRHRVTKGPGLGFLQGCALQASGVRRDHLGLEAGTICGHDDRGGGKLAKDAQCNLQRSWNRFWGSHRRLQEAYDGARSHLDGSRH